MTPFLKKIVPLLLIPTFLLSRQRTYEHLAPHNPPYIPWFTGSLLPPSAVNVPPGKLVFAPFLGVNLTYGRYTDDWSVKGTTNTWGINPFFEVLFGLNDHFGVDIYTSFVTNFRKGETATHFQDTDLLLGYQVAKDIPKTWIPDIRLAYQQTFPTGKYRNLDPKKEGIDATGQGAFQSGINLIIQKLFLIENNFLLMKWAAGYFYAASTHVDGFNTYGGGYGTSGRVFPGQTVFLYLSGEYSFNQRWVFACDFFLDAQGNSTFKGEKGLKPDGTPNPVGAPTNVQGSIAPGIEYNISATSGLLFSIWASIFGKNADAFAYGQIAYYYTF